MSRPLDPLAFDRDLEARRHLWRGLERLAPHRRIAFQAACLADATRDGVAPKITSHDGSTAEAYRDLVASSAVYGLDLFRVCERLERWLRREG
jgi:hypothetical protein